MGIGSGKKSAADWHGASTWVFRDDEMKCVMLIGLAGLFWVGQATAGFTNGQELYSHLKKYNANQIDFESIQAAGYVIGVADGYDGVAYCMPHGLTKGQVFQVAANYLSAHPEKWQNDASGILLEAFTPFWPCTKK